MIDPRAFSEARLVPRAPLPVISRRALRRCKDAMPPPKSCPYCQGAVELVNNSEIYGREFGDWPYVYRCAPCDAHVGLHPLTDLPLGTMANRLLRAARKVNKVYFVQLINKRRWGRSEAYVWLATALQIDPAECHWGMFDWETADKAGDLCLAALEGRR